MKIAILKINIFFKCTMESYLKGEKVSTPIKNDGRGPWA